MHKNKSKKGKRMPKKESPYSLYKVSLSDENKHADTVFIHTTSKRIFVTFPYGYQNTGDLLLAEWGDDGKLGALNEVKKVTKNEIVLGRCIKGRGGYGTLNKVPLSSIEDLR